MLDAVEQAHLTIEDLVGAASAAWTPLPARRFSAQPDARAG